MDFYLDGKLMYNHYHRWGTNEIMINLSLTWETPYFNFRIGETYIHYHMLHFGYTEPPTLTLGAGVNIRPRWNSWNIGLFARNYDDFYYEAYNLNWGVNFWANLMEDTQLFGELNLRPAGRPDPDSLRQGESCGSTHREYRRRRPHQDVERLLPSS